MLILAYIVIKGWPASRVAVPDPLDERHRPPTTPAAGIYHALIGTLEQVLHRHGHRRAARRLFTAIYLVEYGRGLFARW